MSTFVEQNAITNRIEKIRTVWMEATADPKKNIFRWFVKGDERRLLEGWYKLEGSEHGIFPELFLRFDCSLENYEDYSTNLINEMLEKFDVDKEECANAGIDLNFKPDPKPVTTKTNLLPLHFSNTIVKLAATIPDYTANIYVLLYPEDLQNISSTYIQWIYDLVANANFSRLKLVLLDTVEYPMFEKIVRDFPVICTSLSPDLKMDEAMKQMASAGNPSSPDVQFRKLFVQISQAAAKKNYDEMERWAAKAMQIAEMAGWTQMKVALHFTVASAYFSANKGTECLKRYSEALKIAQEAEQKGDHEIAPVLIIQSHSFLGATHLNLKNYLLAADQYRLQAEKSMEHKHFFSAAEGWRMKAYCEQLLKMYSEAWDSNQQALACGKQMDENVRKNSTLPFVGQSLYDLAEKLSKPQSERMAIGTLMNEIVGNDWEEKLNTAKAQH